MKKKILTATLSMSLMFSLTACSGVTQEKYDTATKELATAQEDLDSTEKELESQKSDYDSLKSEYDAYKEKMKPYEEMEAAEVEARKVAAEQEKAAAEQAEAEKQAAEQAATEQAKAEEEAAKAAEEAAGYETGITFDQLSRNPDDYTGKKVKFSGKVLQVMEGGSETQIRLATDGKYDNVIYCAYNKDLTSSRVLDDDTITVYGSSIGLYSYQSTMGGEITLPAVWVDKIDQ